MTGSSDLSSRIAELEAELAELRAEQARETDGAMLKVLIDDIGKRHAVEDKLNQAQEWLCLAQEAGQVAAYSFDFASGALEWSPSIAALYGYSADEEPTLGRWLAAIHPADRDSAQAVANHALQHHVDVDQRFRIVNPRGEWRWIQDRGRVVRDESGSPARLVGINIDVTELVELERRATLDGERLRLALAAGNNACWEWDLATNKVTWDQQLGELAGVADFGGDFDSFWALVHEDDKPRVRAALDRALATGSDYRVEFRMIREDGSIRWTLTQAKVVQDKDGRPVRLVGVDSDITETKLAQLALHESRLFLVSVLGASPDCIKVIEPDGTISFMNANGQLLMEVADFEAIRGKRWVDLWPPEAAPLLDNALEKAREGQRTRFDAACPTAAGTPKWWDVSVAPITGEDGTVERILSISRDVTDRKNADDQLQLLNAELHHRIKNNLATVQALARATLRSHTDPAFFEAAFSSRLESLGKTYGLLRSGPEAATLGELVEAELSPFGGHSDALAIKGPQVLLSSSAAVSVGMILHELTTNASKYGALSQPGGRLAVHWSLEDGEVALHWDERCGRPVTPAAPSAGGGFGSKLIDRLARQLAGTVERNWGDEGLSLTCRFRHLAG